MKRVQTDIMLNKVRTDVQKCANPEKGNRKKVTSFT